MKKIYLEKLTEEDKKLLDIILKNPKSFCKIANFVFILYNIKKFNDFQKSYNKENI